MWTLGVSVIFRMHLSLVDELPSILHSIEQSIRILAVNATQDTSAFGVPLLAPHNRTTSLVRE